ncbi:MAG TPA: hypothetical protein VNE42_06980 [Acidimicrobiales bacterium]|nr:hypothetical protein [Acidimicrobiales bacterium]
MFSFVHGVVAASDAGRSIEAMVSVSKESERFADWSELGDRLNEVHTFTAPIGAIAGAWCLPWLRRALTAAFRNVSIDLVIDL